MKESRSISFRPNRLELALLGFKPPMASRSGTHQVPSLQGAFWRLRGGMWAGRLCLCLGLLGAERALSTEEWSLGAYSLLNYEDRWKPSLPLDLIKNPAEYFFKKMITSAGGAEPTRSLTFSDGDVNLGTVVPVQTELGHPHWNAYRLVFFYGHNNSVPTPMRATATR